jgi:hypothetical protein
MFAVLFVKVQALPHYQPSSRNLFPQIDGLDQSKRLHGCDCGLIHHQTDGVSLSELIQNKKIGGHYLECGEHNLFLQVTYL